MKFVIIFGICGMVVGFCGVFVSSYAIKMGCAQKIADGSLTESERDICRRHGHLR